VTLTILLLQLLLATVTSLPELASGISAVALVGAPNLAVGNALGACVMNLAFLWWWTRCSASSRCTATPARRTCCRPVLVSSCWALWP